MRAFLSMTRDGRYMLTMRPPVRARVMGTRHEDLYHVIGDALGVRHLCPEGIGRLLGDDSAALRPLECAEVEVTLTLRGEVREVRQEGDEWQRAPSGR